MDEELEDLRRRAAGGDLQAQTDFGRALLNQAGPSRSQAIRILDGAAARGGGEAAATVAVLAAAGDGTPQSWKAALEYLVRSAEMGWAPAGAQLAILAGGDPHDPTPTDWRALASRVDLRRWLAPGAPDRLSEAPLIESYPQFASPTVARWLIGQAEGRTWQAAVQTRDGRVVKAPTRTNTTFAYLVTDLDVVCVLLQAKMAAIGGFDLRNFERLRLLRYDPGQHFDVHHDYLEVDSPELQPELLAVGQRIATVLVYLNDDYQGGETAFPDIGLSRRGPAGSALLFRNVDTEGRPDRLTLHAGLPPTDGVKWVVSQWVRQRPGMPPPARADFRSASA